MPLQNAGGAPAPPASSSRSKSQTGCRRLPGNVLSSFFLILYPKLLRESPDVVRAAIAKKHLDVDLDAVLAIAAAWRAQLQETEALRAKQKAANTAMAALPKGSPEFVAKVAEMRAVSAQ